MADTDALRGALIEAAAMCAQAAAGSVGAAMITAHLAAPPEGIEQPGKNLQDAGALASQAAQAASAARDLTMAVTALPVPTAEPPAPSDPPAEEPTP